MRILFTGDFQPDYNRTLIIINGLKKLGVDFELLPMAKYFRGAKQQIRAAAGRCDLAFLPAFTHRNVCAVRSLVNIPILFDPLISRYLTKVYDYKTVSPYSPRAVKNYFKDFFPLRCADRLLADTAAHAGYFSKKFRIPAGKFDILPVGVDCDLFAPASVQKEKQRFVVGFYGGFIPLQGVRKILEAAALVKDQSDIVFELAGDGFEYEQMKALKKETGSENVFFHGYMPYQKLPAFINTFDLALGIFGDTKKAQLVIPNKIFHYAALNKCIITQKTPAMAEAFTNNRDIIMVNNHPEAIAGSILRLRANKEERIRIGNNAGDNVRASFDAVSIARQFLVAAEKCIR
jgi:glycosyltransferase involved in cell wall biosynthesis